MFGCVESARPADLHRLYRSAAALAVHYMGVHGDDAPPSSQAPRFDSFRPEQITLVEEGDRMSLSVVVPNTTKNRALLTVLTGPERGTVHKVAGDKATIGRSDEANVSIPDPGLSRIHARLFRRGDAFFLEDAGSTNGTFVDDARLSTAVRLEPGARFRLGRRTVVTLTLHDELEEAAALSVHQAALQDRLTGVYNRGVFDDRLIAEIAFAKRHGSTLSVVIFDIDHFKAFNDSYGHLAGDAVLVAVGERVQKTVRVEDVLARYGGEEFAVIARSTPADKALVLGERIRKAVRKVRLPWGEEWLEVTASVGIATFSGQDSDLDVVTLIAAADRALYAAKERGRDCVVHAGDLDSGS